MTSLPKTYISLKLVTHLIDTGDTDCEDLDEPMVVSSSSVGSPFSFSHAGGASGAGRSAIVSWVIFLNKLQQKGELGRISLS
mmetsp:Transcript_154818/g.281478  ORF Transcript_154818/g.281478 Transcript_154818/m.281478 type:complete len:82 (+) Transcript_154818:473-718(+)